MDRFKEICLRKGPPFPRMCYNGHIDLEAVKKYFSNLSPNSHLSSGTKILLLHCASNLPWFSLELPGQLVSPCSNQCTGFPCCPSELHRARPFNCCLTHDRRWKLIVWVNIFFFLPTGLVSASVFGWLWFPGRFHVKRHKAKCPYCKLCLRYSRVLLPK